MEHFFELPVIYKGTTLHLKGRLVTFAFSYKFYIVIDGKELSFEKDDEGEFRVIDEQNNNSGFDNDLLAGIVQALGNL